MIVTKLKIKGIQLALDNLYDKSEEIIANARKAMKQGGQLIQRVSQKLVPVQYGVLKASAFTRDISIEGKIIIQVGYTAAYALYVHENLDALHGAAFNTVYADRIIQAQKALKQLRSQKAKITRMKKKGVSEKDLVPWQASLREAHIRKEAKMWFNRGPDQQAKFLEKACREQGPKIIAGIVAEVKK